MSIVTQQALGREDCARAPWHRVVLDDLADRLTPPSDFPCTFSQNAFRRELVRFVFVEDLSGESLGALRTGLLEYITEARDWSGQVNHAHPLIVAFSPEAIPAGDLEHAQGLAWQVLQDWLDHDPCPWPEGVARVPEAPFWSLSFGGMQLFVNMSAPDHERRKSRNLGRHFVLVVNPRERFDIVAGDTPEGRRVRDVIRERSTRYDGMDHAPELGSFEKGEIEWWQYALGEDNAPRANRCPLKMPRS
jgi:N-omega-hydroxy-L-arginine synthase